MVKTDTRSSPLFQRLSCLTLRSVRGAWRAVWGSPYAAGHIVDAAVALGKPFAVAGDVSTDPQLHSPVWSSGPFTGPLIWSNPPIVHVHHSPHRSWAAAFASDTVSKAPASSHNQWMTDRMHDAPPRVYISAERLLLRRANARI